MGRALPVMLELDDVRIASPCNMRWEEMTGGDKVRFCAACQKNVFNLSGMKRSEAQGLIQATEGKLCARFYKRADGTILTTDCPVGLALVARRAKRVAVGAIATSLGAVATVLAFLATTPLKKTCDLNHAHEVVVSKVQTLQEQHSSLMVAEPPQNSYAGGVSMRAPLGEWSPPVQPTPPVQKPHVKAKPTAKPAPKPEMFMGDVDVFRSKD